ncbi:MAG: hypothetical protein HFI33_08565 [Lachnospiraceae bacterium]|nr:hypothetical protein [Lachnospiraceae bacterium]
MVRIKLFTFEEWIRAMDVPKENPLPVESFERLLQRYLEEETETPPFRDEESLGFLKGGGLTFVSDDDWYSVYGEGALGRERDSITNIRKWMKFALTAIYYSRQERYTWMDGTCVPYEWAWNLLSQLPFDILVAVRVENIRGIMSIFLGFSVFSPCRIVNYPYRKQSIEVTIDEFRINDDFYTRVPEGRENNTNYGLHMGKDGRYYSNFIGIEYAFQYYWKNDVEGLIRYIEEKYPDRIQLGEVREIYNTFTLAKALGIADSSVIALRYWNCKNCIEKALEDGRISDLQYEEFLVNARQGEDYKNYVYYRDTFQFISHLTVAPKETLCRKLPVMMVDKNYDGTYRIHGSLTVKYPEFEECICDVVEERSPDRERVILVVDVEELLDSAEDVDQAVYGFRLLQDSLEIFDKYEAVQLFGRALKEAYTSKSCTISQEFY